MAGQNPEFAGLAGQGDKLRQTGKISSSALTTST